MICRRAILLILWAGTVSLGKSERRGWSKLSEDAKLGVMLGGMGIAAGLTYGGFKAAMAYADALDNAELARFIRGKMVASQNELAYQTLASEGSSHESPITEVLGKGHVFANPGLETNGASTSGTKNEAGEIISSDEDD